MANIDQLIFDDDSGATTVILPEILDICSKTWPDNDFTSFIQCYHYVTDFFTGKHPDFPKNTLPYHNLRHTRIVTLATARLFHGLYRQGQKIESEEVERGLICALFHDTGLLKICPIKKNKIAASESVAEHERQSARILRIHLKDLGLPQELGRECGKILDFTNIAIDPKNIVCSESARKIGYVVGSTDIMSQMADRYYLECLPLLYTEMIIEDYCQFDSLQDLFEKTISFYRVILKRLQNDLGGVYEAFTDHFYHETGERTNFYIKRIEANLQYLEKVIEDYNEEELERYLRRTPPDVAE